MIYELGVVIINCCCFINNDSCLVMHLYTNYNISIMKFETSHFC